VDETLEGKRQSQTAIAALLGYKDFEPLHDSNVRREMKRLRDKLRDYYDEEGKADSLIFAVPKATSKEGYCTTFTRASMIVEDSTNPRYIQLTTEARRLWAQ